MTRTSNEIALLNCSLTLSLFFLVLSGSILLQHAFIYQAFNASDEEWSTHKKMIDLTLKRPLAHAVPRHWEYLAVEWGTGSEGQTDIIGAAHAVENATKITPDFCLDVVAGMLDVVRTYVRLYVCVFVYCTYTL